MVVAAQGAPLELVTLIATAIGGSLAAAGASALNQYIDRDMDKQMSRTKNRPIPAGRVAPIYALIYGILLVVASMLILVAFVNLLAAALALIGALYYVVLYTILLKRNTVLNILIGGGAGAIPVLVGWAAVRGTLEPGACAVRHCLLLDSAAQLGVGALGECRLYPRQRADDACRTRCGGCPRPDFAVFAPVGGAFAAACAFSHLGLVLPNLGAAAGRRHDL
mgnify:CR=1 FL=1